MTNVYVIINPFHPDSKTGFLFLINFQGVFFNFRDLSIIAMYVSHLVYMKNNQSSI